MTTSLALKQAIDHRATKLLISLAEAQKSVGHETENEQKFKNSVQNDAKRQLLRVEKQAIRDKELNKKSEQNFIDGIRDMVHESVAERIEEKLQDLDNIYSKVLGFDDNLPVLLDALSVKASSISKVEPLAGAMPWLYDDLIRMVNMPKYRRTDAKGKVIAVETLRVALSYFGIENLKMVVPSLAFRRWIPQITDPFPEIKTRLWESALGTAISCKRIAELGKVDPGHAFTVGLFHDIGKIVVIRLYFRVFDEIQREALIEAHDGKKREEHAALTKIEPSSDFLQHMLDLHAAQLSSQLINKMEFKRVFIAPAIQEFVDGIKITQMCPLAAVLAQGKAYSNYRMLKGNRLINMEEAKEYLRNFRMPAGALSALKTTDLRQLNLTIDED